MRKTLYEILGVDAKASAEQIDAAYHQRVEEFAHATISDPNKLRVLKQALDILSDANQRAAYDASLAAPVGVSRIPADEEIPEPTFFRTWGKWIALAVILVAMGAWWVRHTSPPPVPESVSRQAEQGASDLPAEESPPEEQPEPSNTVAEAAAPVAAAQPEDAAPAVQPEAPANPVVGTWSCFDPVSGRSGHYSFEPDGTLAIDWADGQALSQKYELSGRVVKLTDSQPPGTLAIEQLAADKMILNTGESRRLVCTRQTPQATR